LSFCQSGIVLALDIELDFQRFVRFRRLSAYLRVCGFSRKRYQPLERMFAFLEQAKANGFVKSPSTIPGNTRKKFSSPRFTQPDYQG
jgi:hypothetical protein